MSLGMDKRQSADNNKAYYYHFDGLGSVVALSGSDANSVQTYEYSIYGQVAASDPNLLTNPYMFTRRRFDIETGLYYYRARYYNPHIGRFMQTDPVGYDDGINWYLYCNNNPLGFVDPYGLASGQVVTGIYLVLPWKLCELTKRIGFLLELFEANAIDLGELPGDAPSLPEIDYELALQAAEWAEAQGLVPFPYPQDSWGSFIEVQDWEDTNNDGVVDPCDTFSDPYWLNVEAFGAGIGDDYERGAGLQGPYLNITAAADAAGTAIGAAWNMGIDREGSMRVIPTEQEVAGIIVEGWDDEDPYNRDEHY
jgi:RHS repeat-associated protein